MKAGDRLPSDGSILPPDNLPNSNSSYEYYRISY